MIQSTLAWLLAGLNPSIGLVGVLWHVSWMLAVLVFLLLRSRRPVTTLAWLIAAWSVPLAAAVAYFFLGAPRLDRQRQLRQDARLVSEPCRPQTDDAVLRAFGHGVSEQARRVGQGLHKFVDDVVTERVVAVQLFEDGDAAYPVIENALAQAEISVHLEYYTFNPGVVGERWLTVLTDRARQGVTVRVVIDAIGSDECPPDFWAPLVEAGGEVRVFHTTRLTHLHTGTLNFRTHRKMIIVDGVTAFTGGMNVTDENISDPAIGRVAWRNTHLRLDGPATAALQGLFLEDWLYAVPLNERINRHRWSVRRVSRHRTLSAPEDLEHWFSAEQPTVATGPWVQIVSSGPDQREHAIHRLFMAVIGTARLSLRITTPYFVPDEALLAALITAAGRGVSVQILMPETGDHALVDAAAHSYAGEAAKEGVLVWLYQQGMCHSKTIVMDDEVAVVGSANFDNRSLRLNFEIAVAIYDADTAGALSELFDRQCLDARQMPHEAGKTPLRTRLLANAARLLSPVL